MLCSNIYPNGPMLKEQAKQSNKDFRTVASNEWSDGWKTASAIKEHHVIGEAGNCVNVQRG